MTRRERLGCAALASLALHALVVTGAWIPLPPQPDEPRPIDARLVPAIKPPPMARPPAPRRVARIPAAPAPVPSSFPVATDLPIDTTPAPVIPEPGAVAQPEPPQQLARAAESTAMIAHNLPRRGRITYTLLYGESRTPVGKVVQRWEIENDGYRLASEAETIGPLDLFRPERRHYLSQGKITREGLRPESFLMSRTLRGRTEAAQARFDWQARTLAYGRAREPRSAPLPAGAHDFLSFMFQQAVLPPSPGRYRVPIATGPRFETHEIVVEPEESIETPIGTMRALPVRQVSRPGSESIQIWLAAEYRYLPVRIRHFDREGNYSGEQVANEIRISDE